MKMLRWVPALLVLAFALFVGVSKAADIPPELAVAGFAIGMVAKRKADQEAADETLNAEQLKEAGRTDSQQEIRAYHEGDFQTTDPVTGEPRTLNQAPRVVRLDRGETIEDAQDEG